MILALDTDFGNSQFFGACLGGIMFVMVNVFSLYLFIIINVMAVAILPKVEKVLTELGENIRLARLRRKLSASQICERAGIGRNTLWQIEKGGPGVTIGAYAQVLFTLGLEQDLIRVGEDDILGRRLQDAGLETRRRGPKRSK